MVLILIIDWNIYSVNVSSLFFVLPHTVLIIGQEIWYAFTREGKEMKKIRHQLYILRALQLVCFSLGVSCALFLLGTAGSSELGLMALPQVFIRVTVGSGFLFACVFGYRFFVKWQRHIRKKQRTSRQISSVRPAA